MISEMKRQRLKFLVGFIGWYLVNGLIALLLNVLHDIGAPLLWGFFLLSANVILLIVFSIVKKIRPVALGVRSSMAADFLITLIFTGTIERANCFVTLVPFRSPTRVVTTPTPVHPLECGN